MSNKAIGATGLKVVDLSYKVESEGIKPGYKDEAGQVRTGEIYEVVIEVNGSTYALKLLMPMGVAATVDRIRDVLGAINHALGNVGFFEKEGKVKLDG